MAKTSRLMNETEAADGSSAVRVYRTTWNARRSDSDIPAMRTPYGEDFPDTLVVQRRLFERIPVTNGDDLCDVTLEYATPRLEQPDIVQDADEEHDVPLTRPEETHWETETIKTRGWTRTVTEDLLDVEVELEVPIQVWSAEYLFSQNYQNHFATYIKTVNAANHSEGVKAWITGAAGELLLDEVNIVPDYRQVAGASLTRYRTSVKIKRRIPGWNYVYVSPEPAYDAMGRHLIYEYNPPFQHTPIHPLGTPVYKPWKKEGSGESYNYYLDFFKIGWQDLSNTTKDPSTGNPIGKRFKSKDWSNLIPDEAT